MEPMEGFKKGLSLNKTIEKQKFSNNQYRFDIKWFTTANYCNIVTVSLIVISMSGCCDRRCNVHKTTMQELPQPIIQQKLEKMQIEKGGK